MDAACMSHVDLTDCSNCRDLCLGPVIFPCGHLFCRKCVRQLIVGEGLPAHCSSCHQIIPLVQGETISDIIDNMCKDHVIEKMVYERLRQDRKMSCDLCHETKVTHVCLDCRHYLCNTCSSVHSVSERSYSHKQQILPTTWTTAEIQSQSDASGLEALCRNIECCQVAEETVVDTQTTRSEVEMILYDQICQLKNSEKDVDKLITTLHNVKVRLNMKQQILGLYAAELAKHDQSLVQTEPILNRVHQIKKDNVPPLLHNAELEGCICTLRHCGCMTSERSNTPQENVDKAREDINVEQMVEIYLKETESGNQVTATSQTVETSPLIFKAVDVVKVASRCTSINTDVGTVQLETISDPKVIMQTAENIVVAKIDWNNDRIHILESERREMNALEEKNKSEIMKLERDIDRVTRHTEDERRKWTQLIEEERSRATEQAEKKEIKLRKLEDEQNREIKQLEEARSRLEEEKNTLTSQIDEERKTREDMNEKNKEEMKNESRKMKALEEKNKTILMRLEKDIIRVTRQVEDERKMWTQLIKEEKSRATEQVGEKEVKLRKLEDEESRVIKQLEEEKSRLDEERNKLTSQLDDERTKREDMIEKHKEEIKNESRKMKALEEKNYPKMMRLEKDIIRVTRQVEDEKKMWTQRIEEERSRVKEQVRRKEVKLRKLEEEQNRVLKEVEEERSRLEEERTRLISHLDEEKKKREKMNEKHKEEMKKERKNVIRFVMRLEGRDRLLSDVLGRVEDGHLSQVVRHLLHDFHIRLLGVDCGLNFLMEVPASLWGEVVQEQLQGVLSDLVPEIDRQEVTWSSVVQLDRSQDLDIKLGQALPTPEAVINQTPIDDQDQAHQQSAENYWLQCIQKWYPHLHSQTYFLPPFHFNRVPYCVENIAGKQVLVPQTQQSVSAGRYNHGNLTLPPVSDSDLRDDRALQRVLHVLRELADNGQQKEVMFVVSQLQFDNYLGEPGFAPAAALLPRPSTLPEHFRQQHYDKGDFDVLIIHRHHGLLILEINSVGEDFRLRKMSKKQKDAVLKETVEVVTKRLNKAEVVLRHITSDLKPKINITKSLVMPNIKSSQLQRGINRYPSAGQVLCQCLGVQNVDDAVKLCLLSDHHSDKHMSSEINKSFLQALRVWWQHVIRATGTESLMTSSLYEQLLARFCGPATTVEVHSVIAPHLNIRTLGEAVSETGDREARLVLFPQQVDILNRSPPGAFLSGPPGTGKTIVLIMQGLTWLQRGHDVHVVSTWYESRAATIIIEHQLQEIAKTSTAKPRVHRHQFDFEKDREVKTAVRRLKSSSEKRQLCVIADEVYYRKSFTEFCDQLIVQVPGVFIWGASVYDDVRPLCLEEVKLTTSLRSPPVVVREVMKSREIKEYKRVHDYTISDGPVPTDGPPVMRIKHRDGQSGHTVDWPRDCVECGHEVARVLTELDVGRKGDINCPTPLHYRDVLVLGCGYPTDDRVDSNGQVATMASGLVRGLRECHVPVRVVEEGDEAAIHDTALGVSDMVTVANWHDVQGLERKVVIVEKRIGVWFYRLHAVSRCTSQLVLIDWWPV